MLADTVIREQFHQMLTRSLPSAPCWDRNTLYLLIQTILDSSEQKYRHQHRQSLVLTPLLERAIHEELADLLLTWLKQTEHTEIAGYTPLETTARIVGWAILGAALQWSQEEPTMSREQMANAILQVIMEGTARLFSDTPL